METAQPEQVQPPVESGIKPQTTRRKFSNTKIRHRFIQKVYTIVLIQLAFTTGMIALFTFVEPMKAYARIDSFLFIVASVLAFLIVLVLACGPDSFRRTVPWNGVSLGTITLLLSILMGVMAGKNKDPGATLMAAIITIVIVLSVTLVAFQTKIDITKIRCVYILLFILTVLGICLGICAAFISKIPEFEHVYLVYCFLGVLVYSCVLMYDTLLLIRGCHTYPISPEEVILAALSPYMASTNIFFFLLRTFDTYYKT